MQSPFDHLPPEIVAHIFARLPLLELTKMERVSHRFADITNDPKNINKFAGASNIVSVKIVNKMFALPFGFKEQLMTVYELTDNNNKTTKLKFTDSDNNDKFAGLWVSIVIKFKTFNLITGPLHSHLVHQEDAADCAARRSLARHHHRCSVDAKRLSRPQSNHNANDGAQRAALLHSVAHLGRAAPLPLRAAHVDAHRGLHTVRAGCAQ